MDWDTWLALFCGDMGLVLVACFGLVVVVFLSVCVVFFIVMGWGLVGWSVGCEG
jgi:hypothetical protein